MRALERNHAAVVPLMHTPPPRSIRPAVASFLEEIVGDPIDFAFERAFTIDSTCELDDAGILFPKDLCTARFENFKGGPTGLGIDSHGKLADKTGLGVALIAFRHLVEERRGFF